MAFKNDENFGKYFSSLHKKKIFFFSKNLKNYFFVNMVVERICGEHFNGDLSFSDWLKFLFF